MIEVKNLVKCFGDFTAVDNLSFNVSAGEVLGFLGPNGAGKSTTMKMITGFLAPTSGSICVDGHMIERDALAAKRLIGYLPEGAPSYGDMTVLQFLSFIGKIRGLKSPALQRAIDEVVDRIDLKKVVHQPIDTLSKGFKRRVGIAQAIIHDPKFLILDEPTDGLDPNQKYHVRELIKNLSEDKIVIVSTHILEEVSAVCSRAIIIANGKLVRDNTPAELEAESKYHRAVTLRLSQAEPTSASNEAEAIMSQQEFVDQVEVDSDNNIVIFPKDNKEILPKVNEIIQKQGWRVDALSIEKGRLDDVFRTVTGGQS